MAGYLSKHRDIWPRAVTTAAMLCIAAGLGAQAETPRQETIGAGRITVIDGDTVELSCARQDCTRPERIRLTNIDAPEIGNARCQAEREMGIEARAALAQILAGQPVTIDRCEPAEHPTYPPRCTDKYGRTLARLRVPAGDVGEIMIARGRALPWATGREAWQQRANIFCGA